MLHSIDELNQNLKAVIECVDEGIHIINKDGVTIYYNEVAARLDGLKVDEVIGKHILSVFPSLTEETSTMLSVLKSKKPIREKQQTFTNFKGHRVTTINSTVPVFLKGEVIGALEVSKDITQVKELSEKIIDLQKELYTNNSSQKISKDKTAHYTIDNIIGNHPTIQKMRRKILLAAKASSSVIVYGKTGTGKELVSQAIHNASRRRLRPFIAQNCAAMPETLLESILFGTVKGSFTGAEDRPGLFELAHKGTLFLDEVNSMPSSLQAKLLRILEEGYVRRVGAVNGRKIDVRVIAAANTDPWEAVEKNQLRKDLYFRLNVLPIKVPELKERKSDIPVLTRYFINKFNKKFGKNVKGVSKQVLSIFKEYTWPGNVRELENAIEGAMNLVEKDMISIEHLPPHITHNVGKNNDDIKPLRSFLNKQEKNMIKKAVKKSGGNITKAARLLRIPRQTLQYKLKKYNID